jgi:hypothetical protein
MNKFIIIPFFVLVVGGGLYLLGTQNKPNNPNPSIQTNSNSTYNNPINTKKVTRPIMGEESFGLSICNEVPKSIVSQIMGKEIIETKDFSDNNATGCEYITNKNKLEHILIQVSFLEAENIKKGQEALGRISKTDSRINLEHFISMQENGLINAIYLIMAPKKYVRIDRTSNTMDNEQLITLATKVEKIIVTK